MTQNNPENKIYLTYKSRMTAEAKLRATGRWLNYLIIWYSFCLIIISLSEVIGFYKIYQANFIFAGCSIGLFGLSLFVSGERYFEKADQFRNCYLDLQALFQSSLATENKMKRYAEILKKYENQRGDDYDDMLFDAWMRDQSLKNAEGPVKITYTRAGIVMVRRGLRYGFFMALFMFPLVAVVLGHASGSQPSLISEKPSVAVVNER